MGEVIKFTAHQNRRIRLSACAEVAKTVCLRPAPNEDATDFVARIVRSYLSAEQGVGR